MPLYLQLFHGRLDPAEVMTDWGTVGPTFGPLEAVTTTYGGLFLDTAEGRVELPFVEGLVCYDGVFYGDTCTFEDSAREDADLPNESLAKPPAGLALRAVETRSVPVPREAVRDYLATLAAFRDVLLDLGGDDLATAAMSALSRVIEAEARATLPPATRTAGTAPPASGGPAAR